MTTNTVYWNFANIDALIIRSNCYRFVNLIYYSQYFPTTYITWVFYCITIGITVSTLKIINLLLHRMYDEAQYKTDADLKRKSNRSLKENGLG